MKFKVLLGGSLVVIVGLVLLLLNVQERKSERITLMQVHAMPAEKAYQSEEYEKYYPRQFHSWKETRNSEAIHDLLDSKPQLAVLWAGYGFAKDYNAPRGHAYALTDNINTLRTGAPINAETGPMPTACWTCKSPDVVRIIKEKGQLEFFEGKWARLGHEIANTIGCADCHNPETMELAVNRPYMDVALAAAGMPTFAESTHQQKRSLVCAQCHSEYYFNKVAWTDDSGNEKTSAVVTFPWANGLSAENMETYYDNLQFKDWTHKISKAPMLKAQHPGFEIFQTGIHAQKGVACADCHMPYKQEGGIKYTDHHVTSPLENMDRTCMVCHRDSMERIEGIVGQKLVRKEYLMTMTMNNLGKAHLEAGKAWESGATEAEMTDILQDIRHAQWRWDYAIASHGSFFHAPEETLKLLASANELTQQARIKLVKLLTEKGVPSYTAPDFSTKEAAQKLAGVNLEQLVAEKLAFKGTLEKQWMQRAVDEGKLNMVSREGLDRISSYFDKTK